METIIVGNAPIKNKGEYIDSFDTVVRIKWSVLDKLISRIHIKNVGIKTDILYTMREKPSEKQLEELGPIDTIKVPPESKKKWSIECNNYLTNGACAIIYHLQNNKGLVHAIGFTFNEDHNDYSHMFDDYVFIPREHPSKGEIWGITNNQNKKMQFNYINTLFGDRIIWVN